MFNLQNTLESRLRAPFALTAQTLALCLSLVVPADADTAARPLLLFAPSSLSSVLGDLRHDWTAGGRKLTVSYAGTATLARQVRAGAPADVFISADRAWLDALTADGLLMRPRPLAGNRLVLIVPTSASRRAVPLQPGALADVLGDARLALASVESVPAGRYAKAALTSLGLWTEVRTRLAETADVRAALRLVALGEAPLGVVYATDARAEPRVRVVADFPSTSHPAIEYWAAPVVNGSHPDTAAFMDYLASPAAMAHFRQAGFTDPPPDGSP